MQNHERIMSSVSLLFKRAVQYYLQIIYDSYTISMPIFSHFVEVHSNYLSTIKIKVLAIDILHSKIFKEMM